MPAPQPAKGSQKWWVMTSVAIGVFLSTIDGSIVNVALPTIARELGAPFAAMQWVVLAYLLTLVSLMMVVGRLADIRGKRALYGSGFVIFTIGSLLCAMSPSILWLVLSRVVQGVGASLLMALGAAVASEAFLPQERGKAMGLIGMMVSIGLVSGPTLGGIILGFASWQTIFYVNLPLGVLGSLIAWRVVSNHKPAERQPFDALGAVLLFCSLLCFFLAITLGPRHHASALQLVGLVTVAVLAMTAFVRRQQSTPHPLLDLGIFRDSTLATNVVTGALAFIASAGLVFLLPFFLQTMQGRSPREAGLLLVVSPLMLGLSSPLFGWLSDRVGSRLLAVAGLSVLVLAFAGLSTLTLETSSAGFIGRILWVGLGMGIFQSPNNNAIMSAVPRERLGVASGLLSLTRTLGQTTGVATIGALWAAVVHHLDAAQAADAMKAPVEIQLQAIRWVAYGIVLLLCVALALAIRNWKRTPKRGPTSQTA